jgi:uncharacterized protein YoxC
VPAGILSIVEGSKDWREVGAANRERIRALENEVERLRDRQHELSAQVATIRYLAEQVRELGEDVKELTKQVATASRRALERPTPAGWSATAGWAAVIVSVVALVLVATR